MPFIGKVLRQVAPHVDELVICLSEGSNDGTEAEIRESLKDYWHKVVWMTENVKTKGELAGVQDEMVKRSSGDWILFLSDDDYWTEDQLKPCLAELDKDPNILCYAVNPYQLIDIETYDNGWRNRHFSKFLRNKDLHYVGPWPREMPYSGKISLYWKDRPDVVKKLPYRFYHLSYLKDGSFRKEDWAGSFRHKVGQAMKLPSPVNL